MAPMRRFFSPFDDAADCGKPFQVGLEFGRIERLGVQRGQRILDAVLHHVVTRAHLAAEAVAAHGNGHVVGAIGRGLHQHRNLQPGQTNGIDDAPLFTEVGQGDDDAVDLVGMLLEQLRTALRFSVSLDRAVGGLLRTEHDRPGPGGLQNCNDLFPARLGQMIRKKAAIPYYHPKRHRALP